jgi:trk system potassium uptake protein TrkA
MPATKHYIVLGLGTFGSALASRLHENRCRVTGVDADPVRAEDLKDVLYAAVIGDVTDRDSLEQLGVAEADGVFIALGEDITRSLLATLHCKELGARRIVVKGVTPEHGKLLKHVGVERVVFPETEIAEQLADAIAWPNVLDLLRIDPDHSIMELAVPESLVGETLRDADLRRRYGVWVVGVKDVLSGKLEMLPPPDYKFGADQLILIVGKQEALNRLRDLA